MSRQEKARHQFEQEPGRENRYVINAAGIPNVSNQRAQRHTGAASHTVEENGQPDFSSVEKDARSTHETADRYTRVVTMLCDGWRVIVCKEGIQWILQRRKNGGAERPWRAAGYFRTRNALIRRCATSCEPVDPVAWHAFAALPENFRDMT